MSLIISIQSHQVQTHTQGWRRHTEPEAQPLPHADAWEQGLRFLLQKHARAHNVVVYVGAPHVQWMVQSWPRHIRSRRAFLAYLEYQANQMLPATHPTRWLIGLGSRAQCGDTLPIALVNADFLEELKTILQEQHKKPCRVQPLIQHVWNKHQPLMQQTTKAYTGVLACVEPEWLTLFGLRDGQWASVRTIQAEGTNSHEVETRVEQYALSSGVDSKSIIYLEIKG